MFYLSLSTNAHSSLDLAQFTQALHNLVSGNYLKPSTVLSHLSPRDKRIQYETEEKKKITGFPTAKELREAKEVAQSKLKREEQEAEQVGMVSLVVSAPSQSHPQVLLETKGQGPARTSVQ